MTASAKKEILVISFASFFAACNYGHADSSFEYIQFDAHERGFIVQLSTFLVDEAGSVGLYRSITMCGFESMLRLLEIKKFQDKLAPLYWG